MTCARPSAGAGSAALLFPEGRRPDVVSSGQTGKKHESLIRPSTPCLPRGRAEAHSVRDSTTRIAKLRYFLGKEETRRTWSGTARERRDSAVHAEGSPAPLRAPSRSPPFRDGGSALVSFPIKRNAPAKPD